MSRLTSGEVQASLWSRFRAQQSRPLESIPYFRELLETRKPVLIDDARESPLVRPESVEAYSLKSVLAVPLVAGQEVIGVLAFDTMHEVRPFGRRQIELALAVAAQVAPTLHKALVLQDTEERLRRIEAQLAIARTLSSTLELKPLLKAIAQQAARACDMEHCSIFLWQGQLVPIMAQHADGRTDDERWQAFKDLERLRRQDLRLLGQVLQRHEPVVFDNPTRDARAPDWLKAFEHKALFVIPLIRQGTLVGALAFDNTERAESVRSEQVALATTIASQVALALENARLYAETQRRLRETESLLRLAQTIGSSLDRHEIARRTARELTRLLGADTSTFFELDERGASTVTAGYHLPKAMQGLATRLEDRPPFMLEAGATGQPMTSSDVPNDPRFDHPSLDGLPKPRSFLCAPVVAQGRELGGLLSFWWSEPHDFTEEQERLAAGIAHQMALVLANAHNYEQAQEALTRLQAAQEQLVQSEKFRALAEMAGGVAHDFNNLLTAILGRTDLLRSQLGDQVEEVRSHLETIELAASDGAETVRRLLDFTHSNRRSEGLKSVDVNQLLTHTREVSKPRWKTQAQSRGISIEVVLKPGEVPPVTGNPPELREVLLNLVFNAIDAMPDGGTLTLSSGVEEDRVFLRIRDTGIGMSEEVRQRVFDPFFSTKGEGSSGLGLSASYGIVHRHGGEIAVASEVGRGTTFTVKLPFDAASAPPEPSAGDSCRSPSPENM